MNRRAFLFASLATSTALASARAASGVQVIYVGGLDCGPCRRWKATYEAKWYGSFEFSQVAWYEIEPPRLRDAYQERYWPEELRPVLGQVPRKSGTPRFLVVNDGRLISNHVGVSSWLSTLADLKTFLE